MSYLYLKKIFAVYHNINSKIYLVIFIPYHISSLICKLLEKKMKLIEKIKKCSNVFLSTIFILKFIDENISSIIFP